MSDPSRIVRMASAFQESCLLFAASDLGIFKKLQDLGHADAHQLAQDLALNPRGVGLLLDACAAIGLLRKENGRYSNSPEAAAFLVPGQPGDLSGALRYNRDVYAAWGKVTELARTGSPVENPPELHLGEGRSAHSHFRHVNARQSAGHRPPDFGSARCKSASAGNYSMSVAAPELFQRCWPKKIPAFPVPCWNSRRLPQSPKA